VEDLDVRIHRSLAVVIAGTIALLVLGLIVAVIASRQPEASFPADSPQATVAAYLRYLQSGKVDDAFALTKFDNDGPPLTASRFHQQMDRWNQTPHRVTLLKTDVQGDRATVVVEVASFSPDAFASTDHSSRQSFTLIWRDGAWVITGPQFLY